MISGCDGETNSMCFKNSGVSVLSLECTLKTPSVNEIEELTRKADIILVSGETHYMHTTVGCSLI